MTFHKLHVLGMNNNNITLFTKLGKDAKERAIPFVPRIIIPSKNMQFMERLAFFLLS